MSSIQIFKTRPAAVLRLTGEDHLDFLQNQGTNDLRGSTNLGRYTLWLDHKGLIQGDSFVLRTDDEAAFLVSYGTSANLLMEKFSRHIVADDVEMEDQTAKWQLACFAPQSATAFLEGTSFEPGSCQSFGNGLLYSGRRLGPGSLDLLLPEDEAIPTKTEILSDKEAESMRILGGFPAIPIDIPPGNFNPVEANLLSPVSFQKGCYLGQEVVARVHRMQRLSRRLVHMTGSGPLDGACPLDLVENEQIIGALTSVAEIADTKFCAIGWIKSRYPDGPLLLNGIQLNVASLTPS